MKIVTDFRFLDYPVVFDDTMPRYAVDLVDARGQRIRITLEEPQARPGRILKPDGSQATGSAKERVVHGR